MSLFEYLCFTKGWAVSWETSELCIISFIIQILIYVSCTEWALERHFRLIRDYVFTRFLALTIISPKTLSLLAYIKESSNSIYTTLS